MISHPVTTPLADGTLFFNDRTVDVESMEWLPHPKFEGCFMKHLIKGEDNDNLASCHLVLVTPGHQLSDHIHEKEWEYHHVLEGEATAYLGDKELTYLPGKLAVVPKGVNHKVVAGKSGVVILATFLPPLM